MMILHLINHTIERSTLSVGVIKPHLERQAGRQLVAAVRPVLNGVHEAQVVHCGVTLPQGLLQSPQPAIPGATDDAISWGRAWDSWSRRGGEGHGGAEG